MARTFQFDMSHAARDRFLVWFLPRNIEVRRGESRMAWLDHDYTKSQIDGLKFWQCGDVVFVGSPDDALPHPLMLLARFGDNDWRWGTAAVVGVPSAPIMNAPDWVRT